MEVAILSREVSRPGLDMFSDYSDYLKTDNLNEMYLWVHLI